MNAYENFSNEKGVSPFAESRVSPEEQLAEGLHEIAFASQKKREEILKKTFVRADVIGNIVPGVDLKMAAEAAIGKTVSGMKLSGRERFDYAVIAGGAALAYALAFSGLHGEAAAAKGLALSFATMEFGPDFFEQAAQRAETTLPQTAHLLRKVAEFTADKREAARQIVQEVQTSFVAALKNQGV